jgi:hypothetical protein
MSTTTLTGRATGSLLVASAGDARHEVLQVIVRAADAATAAQVGEWKCRREVYARDGSDAEAYQFLAAEQVSLDRWLITLAAYWRTTEDPT